MSSSLLVIVVAAALAAALLVAFLAKRPPGPPRVPPAPPAPRARPPARKAPPPKARQPRPAAPSRVAAAPPAPPLPPPPKAQRAPKVEEPTPGMVARLKAGLSRTRGALGEQLGGIVSKGRLDDEAWEEVEEALIRADLGVRLTGTVIKRLRNLGPRPGELKLALHEELVEMLEGQDRILKLRPGGPAIWLVTGVNGTGKTTTIAKLASRMLGEGRSVVLAAGDTFRAAAIDQLGVWAERLGVHMVRHAPGADPGAVIFDAVEYAKARSIDLVIADTAGRLHTKTNLMEELKKVHRIASREPGALTEVLLVLDATVGQNGVVQARSFQEAVEVTGLVVTKLDGTAKGGIALAVHADLGIPVKAIGVGEGMEDLAPFIPEDFVGALLED